MMLYLPDAPCNCIVFIKRSRDEKVSVDLNFREWHTPHLDTIIFPTEKQAAQAFLVLIQDTTHYVASAGDLHLALMIVRGIFGTSGPSL
jgi:hypothetical protein